MRALSLFVLVTCALTPVCAQQNGFPVDGNGLLDYCSVIVDSVDSPSTVSPTGDRFVEKMGRLNWCSGYLGATQDASVVTEVNLALFSAMGVTLAGPDKEKLWAFQTLRGPCIPERAPIIQLARVLVKWLREHPERLHEPKSILTIDAFKDAFPCEKATTQKEAPKPNPPAKR